MLPVHGVSARPGPAPPATSFSVRSSPLCCGWGIYMVSVSGSFTNYFSSCAASIHAQQPWASSGVGQSHRSLPKEPKWWDGCLRPL